MGRYAIVITETGIVENVIAYDGVATLTLPDGKEIREADNNAEIGGTWNGSEFVRAVIPEVPADEARIRVLLNETRTTQKWDEDSEAMVDKTADEIVAEKLELKNLLLAELQDGDLDQQRTQMLLRLERG